MFKYIVFSFAIIWSTVSFGQSNTGGGSLDAGNLQSQFDFMMRKSTNYQGHKVIKRTSIDKFYRNATDSLSNSYKEIATLNNRIDLQQINIDSLNSQVSQLQAGLTQVEKEKNSFSLFGILLKKNTYNTLLWGLILGLGGALALFVYRFKRSHALTTKARNSYEKTKTAFDAFRQKTLENEQVLMRRLQDELNKNSANI